MHSKAHNPEPLDEVTAEIVREESDRSLAELKIEQRGLERELKWLHSEVQKLMSKPFSTATNGGD